MSDAEQPPPGAPPPLPPNLPHDSLQLNIIISSTICWFIAAFFVGLRFYTRGVIIRVLGPSDWSVLLALIFAGATCGGVIEQAIHGAGYHVWDLDPNDTASALAWGRAAWYGVLFYSLSLCFSKMAILLLYIHLFTFKWARLGGQILFGIVVISHTYMTLVTFTACIPLYSYWDFRVTEKYCHPQSVWWSSTGLHMVTDFLIFLLPMPVVWTIRLPRRQKYILSAVFGFGFIVCFISILRLLQLFRAQSDPDFTYVAAELSYLTAVEVNGAIVCACVVVLKPFLARFFPRLWGSSASVGSSSRSAATFVGDGGYDGRGGPPTIGSLPTKLRLGPLGAMERDVWIEGDVGGGRTGRGCGWMGGYVEIEEGAGDVWGVDVELIEHVNPGREVDGIGRKGEGDMLQRPPPVQSGKVRVDTEVLVEVTKVGR
ncbi:uncharacterized protein B0H64DRAFT_313827 [Chaetomium fimeti]|uniref:Rhodopsin domain-containing protein n=1 Tax=Chaetomium fimeti TaxID=1854472 RepID=A0AAE0HNI4_9PEZI|nr:hypothetical protein B0H64DRAFT_313827 [Chaetomium fimeti]